MSELATQEKVSTLPQQSVNPMQMVSVALEKGAGIDQLEKFMAMAERWEANEARKAFVSALNAFKANPPTLKKNKHVRFQTNKGVTEYDHATLDHISEEIARCLAQHGISHRWDVEQLDGGQVRVTCVLTHEKGHSERVPMQAGLDQSGGKNNIQALGSSVTYLQRYTLLAATGMAVQGMDDDGKGPPPERITAEQAEDIQHRIDAYGIDNNAFMNWLRTEMKCREIKDLAAQSLNDVLAKIESRKPKEA